MEIDEQKARVVQAVIGTGLFPKSVIYKEFYDMTDQEIQNMKDEMKEEKDADREEKGKKADHGRAKELQKEGVDTKVSQALDRIKKKIIMESGDNKDIKLSSINKIISRNTGNR